MNFQEWVEKYRPFKTDDGEVYAFETYDYYMRFISKMENDHVWTLIESDGQSIIVAGKHLVNRLNYFGTEVSWDDKELSIELYEDDNFDIYYSL